MIPSLSNVHGHELLASLPGSDSPSHRTQEETALQSWPSCKLQKMAAFVLQAAGSFPEKWVYCYCVLSGTPSFHVLLPFGLSERLKAVK